MACHRISLAEKFSPFNDALRDLAMWVDWQESARCAPPEEEVQALMNAVWAADSAWRY